MALCYSVGVVPIRVFAAAPPTIAPKRRRAISRCIAFRSIGLQLHSQSGSDAKLAKQLFSRAKSAAARFRGGDFSDKAVVSATDKSSDVAPQDASAAADEAGETDDGATRNRHGGEGGDNNININNKVSTVFEWEVRNLETEVSAYESVIGKLRDREKQLRDMKKQLLLLLKQAIKEDASRRKAGISAASTPTANKSGNITTPTSSFVKPGQDTTFKAPTFDKPVSLGRSVSAPEPALSPAASAHSYHMSRSRPSEASASASAPSKGSDSQAAGQRDVHAPRETARELIPTRDALKDTPSRESVRPSGVPSRPLGRESGWGEQPREHPRELPVRERDALREPIPRELSREPPRPIIRDERLGERSREGERPHWSAERRDAPLLGQRDWPERPPPLIRQWTAPDAHRDREFDRDRERERDRDRDRDRDRVRDLPPAPAGRDRPPARDYPPRFDDPRARPRPRSPTDRRGSYDARR